MSKRFQRKIDLIPVRSSFDLSRSAPIQNQPFPKIHDLCEHWKMKGYTSVLDIGCGYLRNSVALVEHFKLWICDFSELIESTIFNARLDSIKQHENFQGCIAVNELIESGIKVDAVVMAYVLHTLPEMQYRDELIGNAIYCTDPPHELFIAVPNAETYYRRRIHVYQRYGDGYLIGTQNNVHTFYREYSATEIDELMAIYGFTRDKIFAACKKNQRTYIMTNNE